MATKIFRKFLSKLGCTADSCCEDTSMADKLEKVAANISSNAQSLSESERMRILSTCSKLTATVETPVQALFDLMFGVCQVSLLKAIYEDPDRMDFSHIRSPLSESQWRWVFSNSWHAEEGKLLESSI